MIEPKIYDVSNGAKYTVTICNDRAYSNHDGHEEFIHTWLILTDNSIPGAPQSYLFSFITNDLGGIIEGLLCVGESYFETPADPSYDRLMNG